MKPLIYDRHGQLDKLWELHCRRLFRQDPCINKIQCFCLILWFLISVHPRTAGWFYLVLSLLSLESLLKQLSQSALCVHVNYRNVIFYRQLSCIGDVCEAHVAHKLCCGLSVKYDVYSKCLCEHWTPSYGR